MAWFWRADGRQGDDADDDSGLGPAFGSQSAAEEWLTGSYADLREQGVRSVALYEEDRLVYGPMSLDPD